MAALRPVCVKCGREMHCEKNGVYVYKLVTFPSDLPHELGDIDFLALGDLYQCPTCSAQIITGFGKFSIVWCEGVTQTTLKETIQKAKESGLIVVELKRA